MMVKADRRYRVKTERAVFTTGDVARIAQVAPRTVAKWIDAGVLPGYRIPGSRDRRITRETLIRFLKDHDIPLGELEQRPLRVLCIGLDEPLIEGIARREPDWEYHTAQDAIAAAFQAGMVQPDAVLIDFVTHSHRAARLAEQLKTACGSVILGVSRQQESCPPGFDDLFHLPCDPELLAARIYSLAQRRRREAI